MSLVNGFLPRSEANLANKFSCQNHNKTIELKKEASPSKDRFGCTSLPTICESSKSDRNIQTEVKELRRCRKQGRTPRYQGIGLSLPPLVKEIKSCQLKQDIISTNFQKRPSTPRPVLLSREKKTIFKCDGDDQSHNVGEKTNEMANNSFQKETEEDCHPLFSVSPNGLERSLPENIEPTAFPIDLKTEAKTYENARPLLRREKVKSCEVQNSICLKNISTNKFPS